MKNLGQSVKEKLVAKYLDKSAEYLENSDKYLDIPKHRTTTTTDDDLLPLLIIR